MPRQVEDPSFPILDLLMDSMLQSTTTFLVGFYKPFLQFAEGTIRLSWPFILTMLVVGYGCFLMQRAASESAGPRAFVKYLRIREVFLHRSSLVDYRYLLLNGGLKALLVSPLLLSSLAVSKVVLLALTVTAGASEATGSPGLPLLVLYSLIVLLAVDLGNYWSHRFHHEIPILWQLHKVHHSAEVLNPATALRIHPMETLMNALFATTLSGIVLGVFSYFWTDVSTAKLFGLNVFVLLTNLISGNLRHSHIWLSFGLRLEHILSSPAQHQIHHSDNPVHFNRNYAVHFSVWDWAFGTLYTTTPRPEPLTFGLGEDGRQFDSVVALWTRPVANIAQQFIRRRRAKTGQV